MLPALRQPCLLLDRMLHAPTSFAQLLKGTRPPACPADAVNEVVAHMIQLSLESLPLSPSSQHPEGEPEEQAAEEQFHEAHSESDPGEESSKLAAMGPQALQAGQDEDEEELEGSEAEQEEEEEEPGEGSLGDDMMDEEDEEEGGWCCWGSSNMHGDLRSSGHTTRACMCYGG